MTDPHPDRQLAAWTDPSFGKMGWRMEPLGKGRRLDDGSGSRKAESKDLVSCNGRLAGERAG